MAPPLRPPAPVDAPYVDLRATPPDSLPDSLPDSPPDSAPDSAPESSTPDIDLTEPSAPEIDLTMPTPAPAHRVELVETGSFTRATCSACGWTGPARRSRAVAQADLDRHL